MNCIRIPTSLQDAELIAVCAGGTAWRDSFLLGLVTVAIFAAFVAVGFFAVRGAVRARP